MATFPSLESNGVDYNWDLLSEEVDDDGGGGGLGYGGSDEDEGRLQQYFSPAGGPALKDQPTPPLQPLQPPTPPPPLQPPPPPPPRLLFNPVKYTLYWKTVKAHTLWGKEWAAWKEWCSTFITHSEDILIYQNSRGEMFIWLRKWPECQMCKRAHTAAIVLVRVLVRAEILQQQWECAAVEVFAGQWT